MASWRHVEARAANVLGRIGDRLGWDWLVYSPLRMHQFHLAAKDDAVPLRKALFSVFPDAQMLIDVGCGTGAYAAEINRAGRVAIACEHSPVGRLLARWQGVDVRSLDLTDEVPAAIPLGAINRAFDLAYCIEVAEHVPPEIGDRLVEFCCLLAPTVLFSAAPPGQGGTGHVNEQSLDYWVERFDRQNFLLDAKRTTLLRGLVREHGVRAHWLHTNLNIFSV